MIRFTSLIVLCCTAVIMHAGGAFRIESEHTHWWGGAIRDIQVAPGGAVTMLGDSTRLSTITPSGELLHDRSLNKRNEAAAIAHDGSLFIYTRRNRPEGGPEMEFVKFDSMLNQLWTTNLLGYWVQQIEPQPDGGAAILYAKTGNGTLDLLRLNTHGVPTSNRALQFAEERQWWYPARMVPAEGAGYLIVTSTGDVGSRDLALIRVTADGQELWDRTYGGPDDEVIGNILPSENGFTLTVNSTSGKGGDKTVENYGGGDIWIVKLDLQGNILEQHAFGGSGDDRGSGLVRIPQGYGILAWSDSPADGINKFAPAVSDSGVKLGEWLLIIDHNWNTLADESYPAGPGFDGLLVPNPDGTLLRLTAPTEPNIRRLNLVHDAELQITPATQTVFPGKGALLKLDYEPRIRGSTLQWLHNGIPVSGETNASLSIKTVTAASSGSYQVQLKTSFGDALSNEASLTLADSDYRIELVPSLFIEGFVGKTYQVQTATTIDAQTWTVADEFTLTNSPQRWFDLSGSLGRRFYRVLKR